MGAASARVDRAVDVPPQIPVRTISDKIRHLLDGADVGVRRLLLACRRAHLRTEGRQ